MPEPIGLLVLDTILTKKKKAFGIVIENDKIAQHKIQDAPWQIWNVWFTLNEDNP